jgi:serpin B
MNPILRVLCITLLLPVAACSRTNVATPDVPANNGIDPTELVKANNQFALDLYAKLTAEPGNRFFSPFSISTALGMTYAGARGTTAEEMARTLHFPPDHKRLHPTLNGLLGKIQSEQGTGYEIQLANALWLQKGFGLQAEFLDVTKTHYQAGLREVDFEGSPGDARNAINAWVDQNTKGKIKELLAPSDVSPLTRLVLANAIYFKGDWAARFPPADTHDSNFYRKNGDPVKVRLMAQCGNFAFFENDAFKMVEMPYVGKQLSMLAFVPQSAEGLPEFEKTLTPDKIASWSGQLVEQRINVYFPRFKSALRLELQNQLRSLGMVQSFDPSQADFTGMTGADPQKKLHISKVIHEALVEINEEGTEAAGATAVVVTRKGGGSIVPEPPTFRADRPFLYMIRHNPTGSILFMGRLVDPTK